MDNFIALVVFVNNLLVAGAAAHAADKAGCRVNRLTIAPARVRGLRGGAGKTTIAYEAASSVYPSLTWFVSGATLARAEMAPSQHDERRTGRAIAYCEVALTTPAMVALTTPAIQQAESEWEVGEDQINF